MVNVNSPILKLVYVMLATGSDCILHICDDGFLSPDSSVASPPVDGAAGFGEVYA